MYHAVYRNGGPIASPLEAGPFAENAKSVPMRMSSKSMVPTIACNTQASGMEHLAQAMMMQMRQMQEMQLATMAHLRGEAPPAFRRGSSDTLGMPLTPRPKPARCLGALTDSLAASLPRQQGTLSLTPPPLPAQHQQQESQANLEDKGHEKSHHEPVIQEAPAAAPAALSPGTTPGTSPKKLSVADAAASISAALAERDSGKKGAIKKGKGESKKAKKTGKSDTSIAKAFYSLENTRNQVMCRTGLKGPSSTHMIKFGKGTGHSKGEAITLAKAWVKKHK